MLPIVYFEIHCPGDRQSSGKVDSILRIVIGLVAFTIVRDEFPSLVIGPHGTLARGSSE